jgi:hypothetical protein
MLLICESKKPKNFFEDHINDNMSLISHSRILNFGDPSLFKPKTRRRDSNSSLPIFNEEHKVTKQ